MYDLINQLENSSIVKSFEVLEFIDEEDIQLLAIKVGLKDNTILYVRESITDQNRYSYHWQTETGKLIMRWDNAPHYPRIQTYPHHKHIGNRDKINISEETDLRTVLKVIKKRMNYPTAN